MERIKKLGKLLTIFVFMFFAVNIKVFAEGSADINIVTSSNLTVGSKFEVTLNASNFKNLGGGAISSISGIVEFDKTYLKYESYDKLKIDIFGTTSYNQLNGKFALLAMDIIRLEQPSNVIKFVFTILKPGTTTLKINEVEISDRNADIVDVSNGTETSAGARTYDLKKSLTFTNPVPKSTNANLKSLSVTGQTIAPTFSANTTTYSLSVPNTVSSLTVNYTLDDTKAKAVLSGNTNLKVGNNAVTVKVTAEDGTTTKTYTINVTRAEAPVIKSNDATLKSLGVSGYQISPAFNATTLDYTLTVPNEATTVNVNAAVNNAKAKAEVTGNTNLQVGENTVTVKVTAEDGTIKNYTIRITRSEPKPVDPPKLDSDATLKSLYISGYTLKPTFKKDITTYSINVGEKVDGLKVDAIPTSDKAKVVVTGNTGWNYGMNAVSIVVTAEDGTTNTYTVNVNRKNPTEKVETKKSSDNYLENLSVKGVELNPSFNKETNSYVLNVPYEIEKLELDYKASDKAKVEVIGNVSELLVNQLTTVQVKVTAEDGSIRIYTLNATRSARKSSAFLENLEVKDQRMNPYFDPEIYEYDVKVKHNVDFVDVIYKTQDKDAKVRVTGNNDLKVGNNVVLVKVTDTNGFTKIYQINVEKTPFTILGMSLATFLFGLLLTFGFLLLLLLLLLLLRRKNNETVIEKTAAQPIINFTPEINVGSRNASDDDTLYGGTLNQNSKVASLPHDDTKIIETKARDSYEEEADFDYFDETVTKTEIISAIKEGMETKNTDKLKMLLKQDELNKLKKRVKEEDRRKYEDEE